MLDPMFRKLESLGPIAEDDKVRLHEIVSANVKAVPARRDILVEGENPRDVHLIASGLAYRYKILSNGKRQIVALLIPGDFCDLHTFIMKATDHSIATFAPSNVAEISKADVTELLDRPSLATCMLMSTLIDEATMREWIANIGQRPAEQRAAHLFCELHARHKLAGLLDDGSFDFPLTQLDLADTLGLSLVHMNRSIRSLREEQMISLVNKRLVIHDVARLEKMCGFKANYLHLEEKNIAT